jgi:putative protein-disulfide isomerase
VNASCRHPSHPHPSHPPTSRHVSVRQHHGRAALGLSSWCAHASRSLDASPGATEPWRVRLGSAFRSTGSLSRLSGAGRDLERPLLVYLHDTYCPWSYGYLPALGHLLHELGDSVDLEVVSIGLFHGEPISAAAAPLQAVRRATGVRFGPGYELALADGRMPLDSRTAAAALIGLTTAAPARELEVLGAVQRAFFCDGRSLSDPGTVREIAEELGLDGPAIALFATSPRAGELADEDFRLAHDLGARRGPSLLLSHGTHLSELEGPGTSGDQLVEQFRGVLARP